MDSDTSKSMFDTVMDAYQLAQCLDRRLKNNVSNVGLKGCMSELKNFLTPVYYWLERLQNQANGYSPSEKDLMEQLLEEITLVSSSMRKIRKTSIHSKKYAQGESFYRAQKETMTQVLKIISRVGVDLNSLLVLFAREQKSLEGCSLSLKDSVDQFTSLAIQEKEQKSLEGCSLSLKDSVDQFTSLAIQEKEQKSLEGCSLSLKDSVDQFKSLSIQEKDIWGWGCSPEHSIEIKKKMGDQFSTLPSHKKLVCITAASFGIQNSNYAVRLDRREVKASEYYHDSWSSFLNMEELAMIGELDSEEANYIFKESQKRPYKHQSFSVLVGRNEQAKQKDRHLWFHSGKLFVGYDEVPDIVARETETKRNELDTNILLDKERRKVLKECKKYQIIMEKAMTQNA